MESFTREVPFQEWAERNLGYRGPDTERYALCPDCVHHDAHLLCVDCLRWFCYQHFGRHTACIRVEFPRVSEMFKGGS